MTKEQEHILYKAITAKDPDYDGHVFYGVSTTGIFCRPICPSPDPKQSNVSFYLNADDAIEAGFRPCKRCRPETRQGSPAWQGTDATVARAKKLIAENVMSEHGITGLCDKLGIGERHLRRLFNKHLGMSPKSYALNRQLELAELLLSQSTAPIATIAIDVGFNSLRRFNDAFVSAKDISPSIWRKNTKAKNDNV